MRPRFIAVATVVISVLLSVSAAAQTFPTKPVSLIAPVAPGGSIGILGNVFKKYLEVLWEGQKVIVEHKPGAGMVLGTGYVAKAAPDGYTIGLVVTAHVINPSLFKLPFDTEKDLSGITMVGTTPLLLSATATLPADTLAEVLAFAKKYPGKLNYATPGTGTASHMVGELLKKATGVDIVHIPFQGSGPAYAQVLGGQVELLIDPLYASMPHIKGGRMKPIAVASRGRATTAPTIPAIAETVPDFDVPSIVGFVVPSATPRPIVERLNADIVKVMHMPEVRAEFTKLNIEPVGNKPEEFDAFIRAQISKWAKVIREAGIKVD